MNPFNSIRINEPPKSVCQGLQTWESSKKKTARLTVELLISHPPCAISALQSMLEGRDLQGEESA